MSKGEKLNRKFQLISTAAFIVGLFCGVFFICLGVWKYFNLVDLGSFLSGVSALEMIGAGLVISVSCYINLPSKYRN